MPAPKQDPTDPGAGGGGRIEEYEQDGLVFDVIDRGPLDGEVVVLLHGFPQRAACWDEVGARLNQAGLRTLAPDQRGYSPRARPGRRRDYRLDELVADVSALLDAVGREVHVVGHDWGAAVAWLLAARDPRVRSLTSVSVPHPAAYLMSTVFPSQLVRSWYIGFFQLPLLPERAAASGLLQRQLRASGMRQEEVEAFQRGMVEDGALPGGLRWYRGIPFGVLGGSRRMWRERVHVPVTHVWSDGDSALARRTADLAPRWAAGEFELRVLPGRSHWLPEQAPDDLADIVLDRVRRSGGPQQAG